MLYVCSVTFELIMLYMCHCISVVTQLHTENESLRDKIMELERRLENEDYFAMMYKIACNDTTKDS